MTPKEFKNIAPKLFEIKNLQNGFNAPNEYFDLVEETILSSVFIDSIENTNFFETPDDYFNLVESSVSERIKIENNSIPENYFDSIEDKVFEKINSNSKIISLRNRIVRQFIPMAVAASIMLIFTFQYFNVDQKDNFASINGDDIELWLENGELIFDDNELAYLYEDTEIDGASIFDPYEEEVFDYLNDIDLESLILTN